MEAEGWQKRQQFRRRTVCANGAIVTKSVTSAAIVGLQSRVATSLLTLCAATRLSEKFFPLSIYDISFTFPSLLVIVLIDGFLQ